MWGGVGAHKIKPKGRWKMGGGADPQLGESEGEGLNGV